MTLVPHHSLGALGSNDGEPSHYEWSILLNLLLLVPWLIPVLLTLTPPFRAKSGGWLLAVIVPYFLVFMGLQFVPANGFFDYISNFLEFVVAGFILMAALFAILPWLSRSSAVASALTLPLGGVVVLLVAVLCLTATADPFTFLFGLLQFLLLPVMFTISAGLARLCSRKRPTLTRFTVWLCVWHALLMAILAAPMALPYSVLRYLGGIGYFLSSAMGFGIAAGGIVVLLLPFILLTFRCRVYRDACETLLGLVYAPPAYLPVTDVEAPVEEEAS